MMQKWQYLVVDLIGVLGSDVFYFDGRKIDGLDEEPQMLDVIGGDGWELVTVTGSSDSKSYYFKRPRPEEEQS